MSYNPERRLQLGVGLKAARHKAGLSADRAANLIMVKGLACTRGTLLAWERGVGGTSREPYASDLSVLAGIYGCRVMEFFQAELPQEPHQLAPLGNERALTGNKPAGSFVTESLPGGT